MAKLRPRARIVRTIGDQLISGPEAALIELVKNSYDADSAYVYISISPPDNQDKIIVQDEGHGMSAEDLVNKWLEPATNDKLERRRSPVKERAMLGAKGVGRFASARLGRYLHLKSTKINKSGKLETSEIALDWKQFEEATYLDQVDIDITSGPARPSAVPGVYMEIEGLRDGWTRKQLELLVRELRRLTSPIKSNEDDFKVLLDLSAFTQESHGFNGQELVSGLSLGDEDCNDPLEIRPLSINKIYHYMVTGEFSDNGAFSGTFINQRGDNLPKEISIPPSSLQADEESCGKFSLRLNIYDRESDAVLELFEKLNLGGVGRRDAKKILDENIGIGIYRTGFRIRPYGDAETDWLELERLRVQNPSRKLGLNQVWGMVEIQGERESGLIERSSREGLEHNGSFSRVKRLVASLLSHVEAIRQDFRESAGLSRKTSADTDSVKSKANLSATSKAALALPPKYRKRLEKAIQKDSLELKTSIAELETYQQALASHSTLGLVMSQVLHDGRRFLSDITTRSSRLNKGASRLMENSEFGALYRETFPSNAASIHNSAGSLSKLFKSLDPISGKRRGRPANINVYATIEKCLALFGDAIQDNSISVTYESNAQPMALAYESDLMAALLNIIDNAIHWLGAAPQDQREIIFTLSESDQYVKISISNTGPLIDERYHDKLFTPSFTLKTEGSGIGLAIAREAMRSSKGDVAFDDANEFTTFVIEMRRAQ